MKTLPSPYAFFADREGNAIDGAKIYYGEPGKNPISFPRTVYWDAAGTAPAAQPIRTLGGYPVRSGTPARIWAQGDCSILVHTENDELVFGADSLNESAGAPIRLSDYAGTDETALQRAIDDAAALVGGENTSLGYFVEVDLEGRTFTLDSHVSMLGPKYQGIIVRNGKIIANPAASWPVDGDGRASTALIMVGDGGTRNKFRDLHLDGRFATNGIIKQGSGNWITIDGCYITQFEYWGVRYSAGGAMFIQSSRIVEHLNSVPSVGARKARGIWIQAGDAKVFQNIVNWCEYPLYIDHNEDLTGTGSALLCSDNHLFNGQPSAGGIPANNPTLIYLGERASGCYFSDNYYDRGRIIIRCRRVVFSGGRFAADGGGTDLDAYFVLQPNEYQSDFRRVRIQGPFDWPYGTGVRLLDIDETEAPFTGNKAALEFNTKAPLIGPDMVNEVRTVEDADDTDTTGPYAVHGFSSSTTQSRIVFRDTTTTNTSSNFWPYIGSQGDSLVFGGTGNIPAWAVTPSPQLMGGGTIAPAARLHLYGNGIGSELRQESATGGNSSPIVKQIMSGVGNFGGMVAQDRDFLLSGEYINSHYMHWRKQNAAVVVPRAYSVTWGLSATGEANAVDVLTLTTTALHPVADNAMSAGKAGNRFSQVYAGTGTINTSDEREKTLIGDIPDEVVDAVASVPIIAHKFTDAVAEKGDAARWHFGITAQDLAAALTTAGVEPASIGAWCFDMWGAEYDNTTGLLVRPAGDRYGVRYQEVMAIQAEGFRRKLAELEARIVALEP